MSGQWLSVLTLALALILPLSALMSRRLPMPKWVLLIGAWMLLFLLAAWAFSSMGG
jgi:hypothetical protein